MLSPRRGHKLHDRLEKTLAQIKQETEARHAIVADRLADLEHEHNILKAVRERVS